MHERLQEQFPDKCMKIDPSNWTNIYVVGDVHGCSDEFFELIDLLNLRSSELLICVGDVIRKGPDSAGTVETIRNHTNILSVLGNSEAKYLRGEKTLPDLNENDREFIDTWPLVITWPDNAVVHGGFNPDDDLSSHSHKDVLNMRSPKNNNNYETPFWFDEFDETIRVFFGHTVTHQPIKQENAVALDTGCVYGGKLTAYDTNNDKFYSCAAKHTYVPRDESKYADTTRKKSSSLTS